MPIASLARRSALLRRRSAWLALPALLIAVALTRASAGQEDQPRPVETQYRAAFEAGDRAALATLWREQPGQVLFVIDSDLEASLSVWEEATGEPDHDRIAALHARALFGAEVAAEVRGNPILRDYASAFVGWTDVQKLDFRAGQAAFGRARTALRDGQAEAGLAAAVECRERALALGDWWGTAMGLQAEASALRSLDRHDEALAAGTRARQLYVQLGLENSALGTALGCVDSAIALERWSRARALADDCARTLASIGETEQLIRTLALRARAEEGLGLTEVAAATRAEADGLAGR